MPSMIKMEEDIPSNHPNNKVPILDLQVWVSENRVLHTFYKKKVSSQLVTSSRSALMSSQKRSILVSEAVRRLKNCSPSLNWSHKAYHLTQFSLAMYRSGHSQPFREVVLNRAIHKNKDMLVKHQEGK